MKKFLTSIVFLFVLSLILIIVGYFFGMAFAIIPGINAMLTGFPYLSVSMLPTVFAWLTLIGALTFIFIYTGIIDAVGTAAEKGRRKGVSHDAE